MKFQRFLAAGVAAASVVAVASSASAATALLTSGGFSAGISENGTLYDGAVGLSRDGYDVVGQGNVSNHWGVNQYQVDPSEIVEGASTLTTGVNTATTFTTFGSDFAVEQSFSFTADGILLVDVSVTNIGVDATTLFFQRGLDWKLDPVNFDQEVVGASGASPWVYETTNYGFGLGFATGFGPYLAPCPDYCSSDAGDLGAGIRLNLGSLASGATKKFTYYYGLNADGEGAQGVTDRTFAAGAKYVITGRNVDGTNAATLGISVAAVPEPATWAMMLLGFFSLGAMVRRRRALAA